jgi:hypothetical protein
MEVVLDMTEKQELEQRIDELCARVIYLETKLNTVEKTWEVFIHLIADKLGIKSK